MSWHLDGYDAERTFARGVAPGERDSGGERVEDGKVTIEFRSPANQMATIITGSPEDVRHLLEDALGLLP